MAGLSGTVTHLPFSLLFPDLYARVQIAPGFCPWTRPLANKVLSH
jgi:hypothetical protein